MLEGKKASLKDARKHGIPSLVFVCEFLFVCVCWFVYVYVYVYVHVCVWGGGVVP
jgi:hypothetical protein